MPPKCDATAAGVAERQYRRTTPQVEWRVEADPGAHRPNAIRRHPRHSQHGTLTTGVIDDWDESSTWVELMTDFPNRIIHILRSCPNGLSSKDIAERLGTTQRNLSSRLSKLAAYGIIGSVRGTVAEHGTKAAIYRAPCNVAQEGSV